MSSHRTAQWRSARSTIKWLWGCLSLATTAWPKQCVTITIAKTIRDNITNQLFTRTNNPDVCATFRLQQYDKQYICTNLPAFIPLHRVPINTLPLSILRLINLRVHDPIHRTHCVTSLLMTCPSTPWLGSIVFRRSLKWRTTTSSLESSNNGITCGISWGNCLCLCTTEIEMCTCTRWKLKDNCLSRSLTRMRTLKIHKRCKTHAGRRSSRDSNITEIVGRNKSTDEIDEELKGVSPITTDKLAKLVTQPLARPQRNPPKATSMQ